MSASLPRVLVLYAQYTDKLSYYEDWQYAFETHPGLRATCVNLCLRENARLVKGALQDCDLTVLLHSVNADTLDFIDPYRGMLKDRKSPLLSFVGNEVNLPRISMAAKIGFLKDVSVDFIATQLPLEAGQWLYAGCRDSKVVALPHALNPEAFRPGPRLAHRPVDIGARSQKYWSCLGDNERNGLFGFFLNHPFNPPLRLDIDTASRFDRAGWADFLGSCRGTISTEAGSYYLERDDATVRRIQAYVEEKQIKAGMKTVKPDSLPERIWRLFPASLKGLVKAPLGRVLKSLRVGYYSDAYENLGFDEAFEQFFKDTPPCPVYSKAISSRHFDAIGTKTCQIMLKGKYNGILHAGEHYISLEHDFSNADEAVAVFRDEGCCQAMVDRTYEYVMNRHTYSRRVDAVLDLL
jgi:hypothetical protein